VNDAAREIFGETLEKTQLWLDEVRAELGCDDLRTAYAALRATLHVLRDRVGAAEAAHLGAQLPMLVRGFYYEGWRPAAKPSRERHKQELLERIGRGFGGGIRPVDPEQAASAVFRVVARHVSAGEIDEIKRSLPAAMRELWP
jgi:uncharacterized protein (DUF2267 family)